MLDLHSRPVGAWSMNAYALVCRETGHSVLIDPGDEPETLKAMLGESHPQAIWVTHSHPDHIGALASMRHHYQVPVLAHPGLDPVTSPIDADQWLSHGDDIAVGRDHIRVYHTPGHTHDQICFALLNDHRVIVGDTIFEGGPGKTWSAQEFEITLQSLRDIVMPWPDETICYPGHGNAFCLGDLREAVSRFLAKDHGRFFGDATWTM